MLDDSVLKVSPHSSFELIQLCESIAICEAVKGDVHNWGNQTEDEPAFIAYIGCQPEEVSAYIKTLNTFYRIEWCEVRSPKYLVNFAVEIKIRGMQRYSDTYAFGLDYLVESESAKHIGCDSDEYNYYTTEH